MYFGSNNDDDEEDDNSGNPSAKVGNKVGLRPVLSRY